MRLSEIIESVVLETGEFIAGDISNIRFDIAKFNRVFQSVIYDYQKYKPLTRINRLFINKSYTYSIVNPGDIIPEWISSAVAQYTGGILPAMLGLPSQSAQLAPTSILWSYRKPTLYVQLSGYYEITEHSRYPQIKIFDDKNVLVDVDIPDLENDPLFLSIMKARFLIAIGSSRKAFTLSDLPITTDAADLVSDGKELLEKSYLLLYDLSYWQLGAGV